MDFALTDDERQVQGAFARFCDERVRPRAQEIDEAGRFPHELFMELAGIGLFGLRYPEALGGAALGLLPFCLAISEVARGSLSLAAAASMQSVMGTHFLHEYGNRDVHERLLGPAIRGEKIGTICITEPDAGSDLGSISTTAAKTREGYCLNGQKTWITSAPVADFFTVFARAGDDRRLTIFLVEKNFPGLKVGRAIEKMGIRASPTAEVFLDNCLVPEDHRLGEEGAGEDALRRILSDVRILTGALAIGVARAALEDARAYAAQRRQFGKTVNQFQAIQIHLAEMATDLEAATHLVHYAAWLKDAGRPHAREAAMAKLFASERAAAICDRATRVLGSYGFASEFAAQRYFRDIRFTLYGGGTSEILRLVIAREMM